MTRPINTARRICGVMQPHPLARRRVGRAVVLVAKHAEHGHAGRRPVEDAADEVDEPLRLRPFPVETRLDEFLVRDHVRRRQRLADARQELAGVGGIELQVRLEIEALVVRIDAVVVDDGSGPAGRVLGEERSRRTADEAAAFSRTLGHRVASRTAS